MSVPRLQHAPSVSEQGAREKSCPFMAKDARRRARVVISEERSLTQTHLPALPACVLCSSSNVGIIPGPPPAAAAAAAEHAAVVGALQIPEAYMQQYTCLKKGFAPEGFFYARNVIHDTNTPLTFKTRTRRRGRRRGLYPRRRRDRQTALGDIIAGLKWECKCRYISLM